LLGRLEKKDDKTRFEILKKLVGGVPLAQPLVLRLENGLLYPSKDSFRLSVDDLEPAKLSVDEMAAFESKLNASMPLREAENCVFSKGTWTGDHPMSPDNFKPFGAPLPEEIRRKMYSGPYVRFKSSSANYVGNEGRIGVGKIAAYDAKTKENIDDPQWQLHRKVRSHGGICQTIHAQNASCSLILGPSSMGEWRV
jgi:hypothetical protein